MQKSINLVKLSVGSDSCDSLKNWQASAPAQTADGLPRHVTRMWPKREKEILAGGSIYWVIKGFIQCRQNILRLDEVIGADGIRRCAIVCDAKLVRVTPVPKRPFQGWRYLKMQDSPPDLRDQNADEAPLPIELQNAIAEIGVI